MWTAARAELVSTFVAESHRGQGLGSRMVEDFIAWGRERGAARLHVSAYAANGSAIRFYQRHGFVPLSIELTADLY
jgi:GNAT superfamily N-acetyltransferase